MKKLFLNIFLGVLFSSMIFISCDRVEDSNVGGTSMQELSGDWFVTTSLNGTKVLDYKKISTYNSALDNGKEFWIDDHGGIWDFKVKSGANPSSFTFSGNNLQNENYDIKVNITNGKILKGAAKTTGGNKADSIVFDAEFSDDPGTLYRIAGYKRTGFIEDEH